MTENKPIFDMSLRTVLTNLHSAAAEAANIACKKVEDFRRDIINTRIPVTGDVDFDMGNGKSIYGEVAIFKKFEKFTGINDLRKSAYLDKLKKEIYDGLIAYFKIFNTSSSTFNIDDMVMVVANQYGKSIDIKNYKIQSISQDEFQKFCDKHHGHRPIIGYKIAYKLV